MDNKNFKTVEVKKMEEHQGGGIFGAIGAVVVGVYVADKLFGWETKTERELRQERVMRENRASLTKR